MLNDLPEMSERLVEEVGHPKDRTPQDRGDFRLPENTTIVSADNHFSINRDIFYERFPASMKDRAPRVWYADGVYHAGFDGKSFITHSSAVDVYRTFDGLAGNTEIAARLHDLDGEGIEKEIVFGNITPALLFIPDLEVRDLVIRIYSEYLAEIGAQAPGRFHGIGYHNFWDPSRFQASLDELKSFGIKAFQLPVVPMVNGQLISWADENMDDFWSMIEEDGRPVCFHIGEGGPSGRGGMPASALVNVGGFRKTIGQLIFGGVFDRHPRLRVVFVEAGINWVAGMLQDAEHIYSSFQGTLDWDLQHLPTHYWQNHCYATFMTDPLGLSLLDRIGPDRVMWSVDYPHAESSFGYSWTSMREVVRATSEDNVRKILGRTAIEVFDL